MKLKLIGEITNGDTRVIRMNIESNCHLFNWRDIFLEDDAKDVLTQELNKLAEYTQ